MGNRIVKIEKTKSAPGVLNPESSWVKTFYARDASGNIMANYTLENEVLNNEVEYSLYGSSRVGVLKAEVDWTLDEGISQTLEDQLIFLSDIVQHASSTHIINENDLIIVSGLLYKVTAVLSSVYDATHGIGATVNLEFVEELNQNFTREVGNKYYELSNHLGNVNVVVSDRRKGVDESAYLATSDFTDTTELGTGIGSAILVAGSPMSVTGSNGDGVVWNLPLPPANFESIVTFDIGTATEILVNIESPIGTTVYTETITSSGTYTFPYTSAGSVKPKFTIQNSGTSSTFYIDNIITNVMIPDNVADYYLADVVSATDYYPFGMVMPGRSFTSESYRFGSRKKSDAVITPTIGKSELALISLLT